MMRYLLLLMLIATGCLDASDMRTERLCPCKVIGVQLLSDSLLYHVAVEPLDVEKFKESGYNSFTWTGVTHHKYQVGDTLIRF